MTKPCATIITYHDVDAGPAPLCVDPRLFERQLDRVVASGATAVTICELADALRHGALARPTVAITFDDGFASVVHNAAPALLARGLRATIFCTAAYLGGENDWRSQGRWAPRRRLAGAEELSTLVREGFEIGSHGTCHEPLRGPPAALEAEAVESKRVLEQQVGTTVRSFAYPYGVADDAGGSALVRRTYGAACTTELGFVSPSSDPWTLPRIDAHYLRRLRLFDQALHGSLGPYLRLRRGAARARRRVVADHA